MPITSTISLVTSDTDLRIYEDPNNPNVDGNSTLEIISEQNLSSNIQFSRVDLGGAVSKRYAIGLEQNSDVGLYGDTGLGLVGFDNNDNLIPNAIMEIRRNSDVLTPNDLAPSIYFNAGVLIGNEHPGSPINGLGQLGITSAPGEESRILLMKSPNGGAFGRQIRWDIKTTTDAETGLYEGSYFTINSYDNTGANIGEMVRAGRDLTLTGNNDRPFFQVRAEFTEFENLELGSQRFGLTNVGITAGNTADPDSQANLFFRKANTPATPAAVSSSSNRWGFNMSDAAETGLYDGSTFSFNGYDNTGSPLGQIITVSRDGFGSGNFDPIVVINSEILVRNDLPGATNFGETRLFMKSQPNEQAIIGFQRDISGVENRWEIYMDDQPETSFFDGSEFSLRAYDNGNVASADIIRVTRDISGGGNTYNPMVRMDSALSIENNNQNLGPQGAFATRTTIVTRPSTYGILSWSRSPTGEFDSATARWQWNMINTPEVGTYGGAEFVMDIHDNNGVNLGQAMTFTRDYDLLTPNDMAPTINMNGLVQITNDYVGSPIRGTVGLGLVSSLASDARIVFQKSPTGSNFGRTGRYELLMDAQPETGQFDGSDFRLRMFDNNGGGIADVISVTRDFTSGGTNLNMTTNIKGIVNINNDVPGDGDQNNGRLIITSDPGGESAINFNRRGPGGDRWKLQLSNLAESGTYGGASYYFEAFDNNGNFIDDLMQFRRTLSFTPNDYRPNVSFWTEYAEFRNTHPLADQRGATGIALVGGNTADPESRAYIDFRKNDLPNQQFGGESARWRIEMNDDPETGGNSGTNFEITRRADDGSFLGRPIEIERENGIVRMNDLFRAPQVPNLNSVPLAIRERGMVVYDLSNDQMAYWNGTAWATF